MKSTLEKYLPGAIIFILALIILAGLLFNPSFYIVGLVILALSLCIFRIRWAISLFIFMAPFHFLFKEIYSSIAVDLWAELFLLFLIVAWLILVLTGRLPFPPRSILSALIVVYFIWGIYEIFNSLNLLTGLAGFRIIFSFVPLYFIALSTIRNEEDVKKYIKTMLFSGTIIAAIAIVQFVLLGAQVIRSGEFIDITSKYSGADQLIRLGIPFYRATSILIGPNELGNYLIILLMFIITFKYYWRENKENADFKFNAIFMLMFLAFVFTMSRSSYIGLTVAFAAILFLKKALK